MDKVTRMMLAVLAALVLLSGCSEDEAPDPGNSGCGKDQPVSITPDQLMDNLVAGLEAMDLCVMQDNLDPAFRLVPLSQTVQAWAGSDRPLEPDYLDREAMLAIHENILAGLEGEDPSGETIPEVESIQFVLMEKLEPWAQVDPDLEYFGDFNAYQVRYAVMVHYNLPGNFRFEVDQNITFFSRKEGDRWVLLGMVPEYYWQDKEVFFLSYGMLMAYYR